MALSADNWWRKAGGALLILGIGFAWWLPSPTMAAPPSVEVRNLGISRVGERTMVTVILNQAANPRVTPFTGANRSQVVIEFPQAQAAKLPETQAGDESLVKSVKTEVSATGVKIIVEMFSDRPYLMSREILPLSKGLAMFRLGLRFDPNAVPAKEAPLAGYPPPPPAQTYGTGPETGTREALPVPPPPPPPVRAQGMEQDSPLYKELAEQGRMTTGQVITRYGVPCVEVELKSGETIMSFVHSIPSLKEKSIMVEDRIGLINGTHYLLIMNGKGNVSTDKTRIFVPLDYSIEPQILPQYLPEAAKHEKFILINRRLQYLGLYERGNLKHVFPISSGISKRTPKRDFVVDHMDEEHYSAKYDSPMDHALSIGGGYYIHEGIVPGYAASHGCIRLFPLDARFLFYHWAKPGIPGKITD
jgi:lipoprotein-anchoring transpeptidase ErfK/SrfK